MEVAPDVIELRDSAFGLDADALEDVLQSDARLAEDLPVTAELRGILEYKRRRIAQAMPLLEKATAADNHAVHLNTELFLMRGRYAAGDLAAALRSAAAVLARDGSNAEALRLRARVQVREKDWAGAEAAWNAVEDCFPDDPEAITQRMRIAGQRGDWEAQVGHADRILRREPADAEALRMAIDGRVRARRLDGLEQLLPALWTVEQVAGRRRLVALRGNDQPEIKAMTLRNLLAAVSPERDLPDPGETTIADLASDQAAAWLAAAMRLEAAHDDDRAAELLRAVRILRPEDPDALEGLDQLVDGPLRSMRGRIRGREETSIARAAERVVRLDPEIVEAWLALGRATLKSDPAAAARSLRKAVELSPDDPFARLYLGRALGLAERYAEAIPVYNAAIDLCGQSDSQWREEAERALATCRRKLVGEAREALRAGRPEDAWRALHAGQGEEEADLGALHIAARRAWLKRVRELFAAGDPDRARAANAYLEIAPTDRIVVLLLAREHMSRRQPEAALPFWRRLAAIEPDEPMYRLQTARCLFALRSPVAASEEAGAALQLNPDMTEAAKLLEQCVAAAAD